MKLVISMCLLFFIGSTSNSGRSGYYYVAGYVYLYENPDLLVANQMLFINSDTILSDLNGRYIYKINWVSLGIPPRPHYSEKSPKNIIVKVGSKSYAFKNRPKKYSINKAANNEMLVKNLDVQINLDSLSSGAKVVELYPR
jgi:hypothetical protein